MKCLGGGIAVVLLSSGSGRDQEARILEMQNAIQTVRFVAFLTGDQPRAVVVMVDWVWRTGE